MTRARTSPSAVTTAPNRWATDTMGDFSTMQRDIYPKTFQIETMMKGSTMTTKRELMAGDVVTAKGKGTTKFTIRHIHPSQAGAVLVESGKGETYRTTYINAQDLTYKGKGEVPEDVKAAEAANKDNE